MTEKYNFESLLSLSLVHIAYYAASVTVAVPKIVVKPFSKIIITFCTAGSHSYVDSPFGKPNQIVHFSAVRCVGSESRITDCPTTNYTYEQGKLLAEHLAVAGVACKQLYGECQQTVIIILLIGLTTIFGTATVTLAA